MTSRGIRKRGPPIDGTGRTSTSLLASCESRGRASRIPKRCRADLCEWAGSTTGELFSCAASHIYLSLAGIARDSSACTRKRVCPPSFLSAPPLSAQPRFSLPAAFGFRFSSTEETRTGLGIVVWRKQRRRNARDTELRWEEVEVGARAEVTPAPGRSRGRAPVRSDAFSYRILHCQPLCLRYVIFLTRFFSPRSYRPFCLLTLNPLRTSRNSRAT